MPETPRSSLERLREAQRIGRRVVVERVAWLVYERPAQVFDRRNSPSLVFESDGVVRRVRDFPADWRALSDADLWMLSWTV